MNTINTGRRAETAAAYYLACHGFQIIHRNWRTRYCEIDIVAAYHGTVWFVEVKYRRSSAQGSGFDYITAQKLQRMQFAARLWIKNFEWLGDYNLGAVEVSGPRFTITAFTEC